ncbi:TPA: helix-turn-helix domain-containing protein [Salmonella enterica]|nr:AraC family transcriptional regulator [Salmonella enterica]EDT6893204.1 AraC family transcriptional regulator [Salmonella enterica subsp. enterica serovar Javiana]EDX5193518.1 AraC family transcriptional regulator [Salmonella enterica subsp. enterica serovar Glostrup]EHW1129193.1 AraC family transcriptional regulator [Salmonella enterica subsp. enterica serovar Kinondoni]EED2931515.1 AraC family transcriptional regulator [Salmonella enterica subsp. enterica serovar Javiana]
MLKKNELSTAHREGLDEWSNCIKKDLGFAKAKVSIPPGMEEDQFFGYMLVDELSNGTLKIEVNSSSQQINLRHKDSLAGIKSKIFIINSCNSMLIRNKNNRKIISPGDSIIIPAWDEFFEESFSGRTSVSLILDVSYITDSVTQVEKMLWQNVSHLAYGFEINRIISNFYNNQSSVFCEKNTAALISLLSLESEFDGFNKSDVIQQVSPSGSNRCSYIVNFIKNNIKNSNLCLSMVAEHIGLTERMIQYILSERNVKFHQLLTLERCNFLASRIRNNIYSDVDVSIFESGFESIATACRQFKKIYKLTPKQYQCRLKKNKINYVKSDIEYST